MGDIQQRWLFLHLKKYTILYILPFSNIPESRGKIQPSVYFEFFVASYKTWNIAFVEFAIRTEQFMAFRSIIYAKLSLPLYEHFYN